MFVVNNPEKRDQIFVFSFRTTDLPSHDSFSICQSREFSEKSWDREIFVKSDNMPYNMIGFIDFAQVKFRKLSIFAEWNCQN